MTSHSTENYGLSQWERSDQVLMEDFNADNVKIDEALKEAADGQTELAARVEEKAAQSALAAETNARTSAVNTINATLAKKGNCEIWTTSYTGSGKANTTANKVTFPNLPALVVILGSDGVFGVFAPGATEGYTQAVNAGGVDVTWSGTTMSWTGGNSTFQLSRGGIIYYVFAFIKVS